MQIEQAVVVGAPPREVFLFAAQPQNMPLWNHAVLQSEVRGVLEQGATVVQVAQIYGRRFETVYRVAHYDPFTRVTFASVSGPMDIEGTMTFRAEDPGTSIRWSIRGDCRSFLTVTERLLGAVGRREMRLCLGRLKRLLESGPVAPLSTRPAVRDASSAARRLTG